MGLMPLLSAGHAHTQRTLATQVMLSCTRWWQPSCCTGVLATRESGQTRAPAWGGGGCGQHWPLAAMWVPAIVAAPPLSEELLLGMWWKQQHVLSTVTSWWLKDGAPGGETRRMRCDPQQVCLRKFPPQNQST